MSDNDEKWDKDFTQYCIDVLLPKLMCDSDISLSEKVKVYSLLSEGAKVTPKLDIYLSAAPTPVKEEPVKSFEAPTRFGTDRSINLEKADYIQKKLIDYIKWAVAYGETYKTACEAYEMFKSDTQYKIPTAISTKPVLSENEALMVNAFWDLQSSRNHYGTIPISEIILYWKEMRWEDICNKSEFLGFIGALDVTYNSLVREDYLRDMAKAVTRWNGDGMPNPRTFD